MVLSGGSHHPLRATACPDDGLLAGETLTQWFLSLQGKGEAPSGVAGARWLSGLPFQAAVVGKAGPQGGVFSHCR